MDNTIGIIGFGTVGTVLSNILDASGKNVLVYDILMEDAAHKGSVLAKAREHKAKVVDLPSLIERSTYIISTVTTQVAETVANKCGQYLKERRFFIDCNSTSPGIKINIQNIIEASKADFIEGVILNAVNPGDTTIEMLIGGEKGKEVVNFLEKFNIKAKFYSHEVGKASMFKMLRSIFSKGLEVLLIEMLVSAKKAGIEKDLWKEITSFMDSKPFAQIGETWIKSHATAYERRFHEMQQVIETMNEIGVSPILTKATLEYFEHSRDIKLKSFFLKAPQGAEEVISVIADNTGAQQQGLF